MFCSVNYNVVAILNNLKLHFFVLCTFQVIDHLCHVNRMIECHPDYNSVDVEVAADLFNEDSQVLFFQK